MILLDCSFKSVTANKDRSLANEKRMGVVPGVHTDLIFTEHAYSSKLCTHEGKLESWSTLPSSNLMPRKAKLLLYIYVLHCLYLTFCHLHRSLGISGNKSADKACSQRLG